ncbi:MAG: site-specific DNA-methyltransferase [Clostridiales bacterium]|nr:site-specific DNA-methyltransferase [Clostridiales bacterium]
MKWEELKQQLLKSDYYYFHTNNGVLLCGDCLEILPLLSKEIFSLIILDPSYDMWGNLIKKSFINVVINLIKQEGNILLFTKPPFDYELRIAIDKYFRDELIWTFGNGQAWVSNRMPLRHFQKIYHVVKSKNYYFNPRTGLEYSPSTKDGYRTGKSWQGWERTKYFKKSVEGIWIKNHLHFNKPNNSFPNSKPKKLIEVLIKVYSEENNVVLDPFLGTGTTTIACEKNSRKWVGIEISPKYCEIAKERILRENKQMKLF